MEALSIQYGHMSDRDVIADAKTRSIRELAPLCERNDRIGRLVRCDEVWAVHHNRGGGAPWRKINYYGALVEMARFRGQLKRLDCHRLETPAEFPDCLKMPRQHRERMLTNDHCFPAPISGCVVVWNTRGLSFRESKDGKQHSVPLEGLSAVCSNLVGEEWTLATVHSNNLNVWRVTDQFTLESQMELEGAVEYHELRGLENGDEPRLLCLEQHKLECRLLSDLSIQWSTPLQEKPCLFWERHHSIEQIVLIVREPEQEQHRFWRCSEDGEVEALGEAVESSPVFFIGPARVSGRDVDALRENRHICQTLSPLRFVPEEQGVYIGPGPGGVVSMHLARWGRRELGICHTWRLYENYIPEPGDDGTTLYWEIRGELRTLDVNGEADVPPKVYNLRWAADRQRLSIDREWVVPRTELWVTRDELFWAGQEQLWVVRGGRPWSSRLKEGFSDFQEWHDRNVGAHQLAWAIGIGIGVAVWMAVKGAAGNDDEE